MSSLSGKVQTVLGLIEPSNLGRTLTHEHLSMTFDCAYCPPPTCHEVISKEPIIMKNLFWLQKNPYSHKENLQLNQEMEAIREELLHFKAHGGGAMVENTTYGISRNVQALRWLAEETGVHIIAGAGFYVDATHTPETRAMSVEQVKVLCSLTVLFVHNFSKQKLSYAGNSDVAACATEIGSQGHLPMGPRLITFHQEKNVKEDLKALVNEKSIVLKIHLAFIGAGLSTGNTIRKPHLSIISHNFTTSICYLLHQDFIIYSNKNSP